MLKSYAIAAVVFPINVVLRIYAHKKNIPLK